MREVSGDGGGSGGVWMGREAKMFLLPAARYA